MTRIEDATSRAARYLFLLASAIAALLAILTAYLIATRANHDAFATLIIFDTPAALFWLVAFGFYWVCGRQKNNVSSLGKTSHSGRPLK
jgi:hypothetical protein